MIWFNFLFTCLTVQKYDVQRLKSSLPFCCSTYAEYILIYMYVRCIYVHIYIYIYVSNTALFVCLLFCTSIVHILCIVRLAVILNMCLSIKNDGNQKITLAVKWNFSFDFWLVFAISRRFFPFESFFAPTIHGWIHIAYLGKSRHPGNLLPSL